MAVCPTPNLIRNARSKRGVGAATHNAAQNRRGYLTEPNIIVGAPSFSPYLPQPNGAGFIQLEDFAGLECRAFFGIGQLFAAPLDAALFDKAADIAPGTTQFERDLIGSDDGRNQIIPERAHRHLGYISRF